MESVREVSVSRDIFNAESFDVTGCEGTHDIAAPHVGHLDLLGGCGNNTEFLEGELEVLMDDFSPVDNYGDGISSCYSGGKHGGLSPGAVPVGASEEAGGLFGVGVLVHSDQVFVLEDGERLWSDGGQVASNNQRGLGESPQSEMGLLFINSHASISHFEHVGVVPASRATSLKVLLTLPEVELDG